MNRKIEKSISAKMTTDGAGVQLDRVFGYKDIPEFDPFLLLDYFETHDPKAVSMGFPWHPHRGIETITYILRGQVEHSDSIGNSGLINKGQVQWMTAGRGIIHQEMPKVTNNGLQGFQLWLNLPAKDKMTEANYVQISEEDIPIIKNSNYKLKVIAGKINNVTGPLARNSLDILLINLKLEAERSFELDLAQKTVFIFLYEGEIIIEGESILPLHVLKLTRGRKLLIRANNKSKMLIGAGNPINEPIAWGGPIVMNTKEELNQAFLELDDGSFLNK